MRSFGAVSLVLLGCAPFAAAHRARAQRGGSAGAGAPAAVSPARGGFTGGVRAGSSTIGRGGVSGSASRLGGSATPAVNRANGASGSLFLPPGITSTAPLTYSNGIRRYDESGRRGDRERGGFGFVTFGYPGYLDDSGFGYDADFPDAAGNPNVAANGFGADAPMYPPPGQGNDPESADGSNAADRSSAADVQDPPPYVAAPTRPRQRPPAAAAPPPLPEEDAITIVFKDGRPPEQIRNYALTRTTLYITAGRVRTIPVDQIDLAATEKINEKAGVEFQLPSAK